ncbi:MAG TPA: glycosyltransferase [Solirubrobacterales bacterium]|nr:glycosyltransferase [Solirubrobacterales bacterium]
MSAGAGGAPAPEVSVYIQTYQQRGFIADAVESVLAQRTPFETEIVIADDCSTDGTRELLLGYRDRHPDRIRLLLPERNLGPTEIFQLAAGELRGNYVAWLDGDDYWTDPEKLVRQLGAMREHPEWAGCFHDATVRQVDGSAPDRGYAPDDLPAALGFAELLRSNPVPSLSVMARGDLVRNLPGWVWEGLWSDWLALLAIAQHGPLGYLPEQMGVYRVHSAGISSGLSRAEQLEEDLRLYDLLGRVLDGRHRPELEAAVRSRRGQLAVERGGIPFSGAVALLARAAEAPDYLNGRQVRQLDVPDAELTGLDARDRDGTLAIRLERMLYGLPALEPGAAHFTAGEPLPEPRPEGGLYVLALGPMADWLTRYSRLGRQLEGASKVVSRDDDHLLLEVTSAIGAPAPMGALVEITEVAIEPVPDLAGGHIDRPLVGAKSDAHTVEFSGWAIGADSAVVAIELVAGGRAFRRVPIGLARPDLEAAYPDSPGAGIAGFRTDVSLVGGPPEQTIEVRAVLKDQRRAAIGTVKARTRWQKGLDGAAPPLVSVVIPCYGQARFLEEAIESVLLQTYAQVEVVVVDDGSPDNAARVAGRFPWVRCVRQPNAGLAAARNAGIRESEGELLVFLDADDRLLPRALELGVEELRAHPEAAFAFGRYRRVAEDGRPLSNDEQPRPEADPYSLFLRCNYAGVPAAGIYRRSALEEAGNFDETVPGAEDYDLGLRLSRQYPVRPYDEEVVEYRVHGSGMSQNAVRMLKKTRQVLRRQRRHLDGDAERRSAYRDGHRFWRRYYGDVIVNDTRSAFANREPGRGLRGLATLARRYPRGLPAVFRRPRAGG